MLTVKKEFDEPQHLVGTSKNEKCELESNFAPSIYIVSNKYRLFSSHLDNFMDIPNIYNEILSLSQFKNILKNVDNFFQTNINVPIYLGYFNNKWRRFYSNNICIGRVAFVKSTKRSALTSPLNQTASSQALNMQVYDALASILP